MFNSKKILETKNQVKIKLYEDYLKKNNITYKLKYSNFAGCYTIHINKKDFEKIDEKEILGDLYGSVEKSYFGMTEFPNRKNED